MFEELNSIAILLEGKHHAFYSKIYWKFSKKTLPETVSPL